MEPSWEGHAGEPNEVNQNDESERSVDQSSELSDGLQSMSEYLVND